MIKEELIQNEVTVDTDFNFQVKLYDSTDDSAYIVDSATVKFLKVDGTTILDTAPMSVGIGIISETLAAAYLDEIAINNSAYVTFTKSGVTEARTFSFHVVKQIIGNPLLEQGIFDQYEMIEKHKPSKGYFKKIDASFKLVKEDLRDMYGLQYSLGMIGSAQIKQLVLLRTVCMICQDFAAGKGMSEDNYWFMLLEKTENKYAATLEKRRLQYDSTMEESVPDLVRTPYMIELQR